MSKYALRKCGTDEYYSGGSLKVRGIDNAHLFERIEDLMRVVGTMQAMALIRDLTEYEIVPCGLAYVPVGGAMTLETVAEAWS